MAATVTIIGPPTQLRAILQHPGTTMRRSNQEKNEPFGIFWDVVGMLYYIRTLYTHIYIYLFIYLLFLSLLLL